MRNGMILMLGLAACGGGTEVSIPEAEPPVAEATPAGLQGQGLANGSVVQSALAADDLRSRFYSQGPTEIASLLRNLDDRMTEIEVRAAEDVRPCLEEPAVPVDLTVFGETVTAYFQCHDVFEDEFGGLLFGENDGVWYLFENVGQVRQLASIQPLEDGGFAVNAHISVGQRNAELSDCGMRFDGCSYGGIRLQANSSDNTLELSTAGVPRGWGFCAAHLKSDGVNVYSVGQGVAAGECVAPTERCVLGADLAGAGECTSIDSNDFVLDILGSAGEPGLDGERLDRELRFTGSGDAVHFGPEPSEFTALEGVSAF